MKRIKLAIFVASVITTNYAHAADRLPGTDKVFAAGKPAVGHHRSPRATGAAATPAGSTTWATSAPQTPTDLRSVMTAEQAAKQPPLRQSDKPKASVATGVAAPGKAAATGATVVANAGASEAAGNKSSIALRSTSPGTISRSHSPRHRDGAADASDTAATSSTGTGYGLPLPTLAVASVTTTGGSDVTATGSPTTASHSTRSRSRSPRHFGGAADASGMAAPGSTGTTAASDTCAAGAGSGPSGTATEDDDFTVVADVDGLPTRGRKPHRETSAVARDRSATPNLWEKNSMRKLGWIATLFPHTTASRILSGFMTGRSDVDKTEFHKGVHVAVCIAEEDPTDSYAKVKITKVAPGAFNLDIVPAVVAELARRGKEFEPHLETLGDLNLLCKEGEDAAAKNLAKVVPLIEDFQAAVAAQHTTVKMWREHNKRCRSPKTSRADAGIDIDDRIESLTTAFRTALKIAAAQAAEELC